jgi:hypothetical protein
MTISDTRILETKQGSEAHQSAAKSIVRSVQEVLEKKLAAQPSVTLPVDETDSTPVPEVKKEPFVLNEWLKKLLGSDVAAKGKDVDENKEIHQYVVEKGKYFIHWEWDGKRLRLSTTGEKYTHFSSKELSEKAQAAVERSVRWSKLFPQYVSMVNESLSAQSRELAMDFTNQWENRTGVNPIYTKALKKVTEKFTQLNQEPPQTTHKELLAYFTGELIENAFTGRSKRTWQVAAAYCVATNTMTLPAAQEVFGLDKSLEQLRAEKAGAPFTPAADAKPLHPETVRVESLITREPVGQLSAWYEVSSTLVGRLVLANYYVRRTAELTDLPMKLTEEEAAKRTVAEMSLMMMLRIVPEDEAMQLIESMPSVDLYHIAEKLAADYSQETQEEEVEED